MGKEEYCGKWRYAINKRLRQAISQIEMTITLFHLSSEKKKHNRSLCGTHWLSKDCPFLANDKDHDFRICFAPVRRPDIGCLIYPYCKRGQRIYLNLRAWKSRAGCLHD